MRLHPRHAATAQQEPTRTSRLRDLARRALGAPYDRAPCLHALRSADTIEHPDHPGNVHRRLTRWTEAPCVRPAGHGYVDGVLHRDSIEAWHACDDGRTWR